MSTVIEHRLGGCTLDVVGDGDTPLGSGPAEPEESDTASGDDVRGRSDNPLELLSQNVLSPAQKPCVVSHIDRQPFVL